MRARTEPGPCSLAASEIQISCVYGSTSLMRETGMLTRSVLSPSVLPSRPVHHRVTRIDARTFFTGRLAPPPLAAPWVVDSMLAALGLQGDRRRGVVGRAGLDHDLDHRRRLGRLRHEAGVEPLGRLDPAEAIADPHGAVLEHHEVTDAHRADLLRERAVAVAVVANVVALEDEARLVGGRVAFVHDRVGAIVRGLFDARGAEVVEHVRATLVTDGEEQGVTHAVVPSMVA